MKTFQIISIGGGRDLSSRSLAARIRIDVETALGIDPQVGLDFSGIRTISGSFADELFGVFVAEHSPEYFREHVKVSGLAESPRQTILESVAERLNPTA